MQVREIMTAQPACCTGSTTIRDAAQMMIDHDCGELPVVDSLHSKSLIGVITDRDICCRAVAKGWDANSTPVQSCMTSHVVSVSPNTDVEECRHLMEENQIRRIPVVDANGTCCGIVSQADVVAALDEQEVSQVVRSISQPSRSSSRVSPS